MRYPVQGCGKSGGLRVIYYRLKDSQQIYMLVCVPEVEEGRFDRQGNHHPAGAGEGVMIMEKALFADLVQSLKEASAIVQGAAPPSRRFEVTRTDVKAVREQIGLSQSEFARLMRVSVKTLQNWEQHRRYPTGPAAALLAIVSAAPELALQALHR
jgi:putative transcriptional regulator